MQEIPEELSDSVYNRLDIQKLAGQADGKNSCQIFLGKVSFGDGTIATVVSCVLAGGGKENVDQSLIKDVFDLVVKKLEGASSGSLAALTLAGEASRQFVAKANFDVSFCHALFYKKASYIFRDGDRIKIWVFDPPKSKELKFNVGSGMQKAGQFYLIATEKFLSAFDLSEHLMQEELDIGELVDELATEISAKEDQSEIGAAIVQIKEDKPKPEAVLPGEDEPKDTEVEVKDSIDTLTDESDIASEELRSVPTTESVSEAEEVSEQAAASNGEIREKPRFKNLIPAIFSATRSEIIKLKSGDIKALFRLRRNIVLAALIILLVLTASAIFTIRGGSERKKLDKFNSHMDSAASQYEEAVAILSLNKSRAREILISADGEVKKAQELIPKDEKAGELSTKIGEKLKETENLSNVNFRTLVEVDGDLVSIAKSGKNLVGFTSKSIFEIDLENKSADEMEGRETTVSGYVYDNFAFVYLGGDVYKIALANSNIEKAFSGEKANDIAVFLGNVYLLGDNQIFKHTPIEGGYGDGVDYFNDSEQLEASSRFAIDGSVWVTKGSSVLNYLRGEKQDFAISGLAGGELKFGPIFTDVDVDNLYVVDVANSALLKIGKDGIYTTSYQSPEFKNVSDLVVDEAGGRMYVGVGNKILEADL